MTSTSLVISSLSAMQCWVQVSLLVNRLLTQFAPHTCTSCRGYHNWLHYCFYVQCEWEQPRFSHSDWGILQLTSSGKWAIGHNEHRQWGIMNTGNFLTVSVTYIAVPATFLPSSYVCGWALGKKYSITCSLKQVLLTSLLIARIHRQFSYSWDTAKNWSKTDHLLQCFPRTL